MGITIQSKAATVQGDTLDALRALIVQELGNEGVITQALPRQLVAESPRGTVTFSGSADDMMPLIRAVMIYQGLERPGDTSIFFGFVKGIGRHIAQKIYLVLLGEEVVREYQQLLLRLSPNELADVYNSVQRGASIQKALLRF